MGWGPTKSSGFGSVIGRGARDVLRSPLSDAVRRVSGNKPSKFITQNSFTGGEPIETPYGTWYPNASTSNFISATLGTPVDLSSIPLLTRSDTTIFTVITGPLIYDTDPAEPLFPRGILKLVANLAAFARGTQIPLVNGNNYLQLTTSRRPGAVFTGTSLDIFATHPGGVLTGTAAVYIEQLAPGYFD